MLCALLPNLPLHKDGSPNWPHHAQLNYTRAPYCLYYKLSFHFEVRKSMSNANFNFRIFLVIFIFLMFCYCYYWLIHLLNSLPHNFLVFFNVNNSSQINGFNFLISIVFMQGIIMKRTQLKQTFLFWSSKSSFLIIVIRQHHLTNIVATAI